MFFFLSKTVSYLLMPLSLVFLCWLTCLFVKRPRLRKIFFWTGLGLLLFFSNGFFANVTMRAWEPKPVLFAEMEPHQLAVVLTGATNSNPYTHDRVYFNKGADRVTHTVQLYKLGLLKKILISGGSGKLTGQSEPEANQFRNAMIMMGVDSAAIIIENQTRNTHESAIAVKPILDSLGFSADQCLLITSAFHMRRSLACYRKVGVNLKPFPTDYYTHEPEFSIDEWIAPNAEAINIWTKLFREWVGFAAYKAAGYV
jgi:uncharacterized SAM-binding protein YcdF (DUF218 family)